VRVTVLRLGLLSTARINSEILSAASGSDRVQIVAVASRENARAEAYAREQAIPRAHGSYEALLDDAEVDAIYVPLPNGLHHEWTMRALRAGKHVLCEKPYSRHPGEVEEAFAVAEESRRVLMEAFMYRHHPQTGAVADLVAGGALGRLRAIRATFTFRLERAEDPRLLPELAGGSLMDVGCYCVSGSRLLAGEPLSVHGEAVWGQTGVDLGFHGTLRFEDDVVAQFDSSFTLPRFQRLEALGDDGSLLVEAPWRPDFGGDVILRRGAETTRVEVPGADMFRLELENFAAAIAGEAPPLLGRADALGQARAIDALYRSAAEGRVVTL
jgi:D-xylose 1-dehydrogenase (NADP+, D-xylono-1,5-lactone-forming)